MTDRTKGIALAVATTIVWGAGASFSRMISADGVSQLTVMAFRTPVVALILAAVVAARRGTSALFVPRRTLAFYILSGLFTIALNATGYNTSCVYLSVPQAVILHYTFPMLTMLGDCFITGERPTVVHFVSGVLILVGLYVGFIMGHGFGAVNMIGIAAGCISVFGMASGNLLTRTMMKGGHGDPAVQLMYANISAAVMIWISITIHGGWGDVQFITPRTVALMIYPTVVNGLIGFVLLFEALKYIPATLVSLICSLEVATTIAVMPIILGTLPTLQEGAGAATIMFAVALSMLGRARSAKTA